MKMRIVYRLLVVSIACTIAAQSIGQVYKWVDEDGTTHFGSRPPSEEQSGYEEVEISDTNTSAPPSEEMKKVLPKNYTGYSSSSTRRVSSVPDYVCRGARDRVKNIEERWQNTRHNGYTQGEKQRYEQRKAEAQRHAENVCR